MMGTNGFKPGDWVIYRKRKISSSPGPRARNTMPAAKGETYNYVVEKYWIVSEVAGNGQIQLVTRLGKQHVVPGDDPRMRRPTWWERWLYSGRFRAVENSLKNESAHCT
jgi:hypothetical protein